MTDFLDFLKNDKYKEWNNEQKAKRDALLRSMIGETPAGKPHFKVKEDDIELVTDTKLKFDDSGNFRTVKMTDWKQIQEEKKQKQGVKSLDELEEEEREAKIAKID